MNPRSRFRELADRRMDYLDAHPPTRVPLTANQHILHLLLTVFTFGLWGIVWFIRAMVGNRAPLADDTGPHASG
jgi:hypothetical protein